MEGFLTVAECAALKDTHRQSVWRAIKEGRLAAERAGHAWLIRRQDADAWQPARTPQERGQRGGRPRKPQGEEASE